MAITKRTVKGAELTHVELDANFTTLEAADDVLTTAAAAAQAAADTAQSGLNSHEALSVAHGVAGALVGTTDTQTLTNKTLVAASNTVTTAPSGNLTATELNAALAELQTDVDTRATSAGLVASTGSTLVGDDDGASGSLWTTVRGFITYLRSSLGSSIVGFLQSGTGAVARTAQDKMRERVSILDFIPVAEHPAIIAGTSVYDASTDLSTALAAFPNGATLSVNASGFYKAVPEIWFPAGKYYFASTIELKKTVRLRGESGGHPTGYATLLQFAENITGIKVQSYNTIGDTVESTPTGSGGGSIIEGFGIFGTFTGTVGHGVHIKASCELKNCNIVGFAEDGVHIFASAGAGGATEGNANSWRASNLRIQQNGGHGFFVKGADANSGTAISVDVSNNGKCGIFDSSFLGNTYIGCHSDSNGSTSKVSHGGNWYYCISDTLGGSTTPGTDAAVWVLIGAGGVTSYYPAWVSGGTYYIGSAYRSDDANARNVFLGCYSESGSSPPSMMKTPAVVVGGLHAAGWEAATTAMIIGTNGNDISDATFPSATASTRVFSTRFGRNRPADVAIDLLAAGDHPNGVQFAKWHEANKTWGAWYASATPAWWMTTSLSTETAGRSSSIGPGKFLFPNGMWLGSANGTAYRHMTVMSAAPTAGEWSKGDVVLNQDATAGGFIGWVCTTTGTPGTWKTFGAISA